MKKNTKLAAFSKKPQAKLKSFSDDFLMDECKCNVTKPVKRVHFKKFAYLFCSTVRMHNQPH